MGPEIIWDITDSRELFKQVLLANDPRYSDNSDLL